LALVSWTIFGVRPLESLGRRPVTKRRRTHCQR
jgi:hypothetical protein